MREVGVLLDTGHKPLYWHVPADRSSGYLPDSQDLWDVIWERRSQLRGFAHVHPGGGVQGPSIVDITTFEAIETALGRKLEWWIVTHDSMSMYNKVGNEKQYACRGYILGKYGDDLGGWYTKLMELANMEGH